MHFPGSDRKRKTVNGNRSGTGRDDASFANAFDRAAVGMCRRVDYSDGTAQMWGNSSTACFTEVEGGNDSGVELLYCFDKEHKLRGIAANVACLAQCVQHRLFVSPDYWGETRKLVKEYFGEDVFLLPLCSAAGDLLVRQVLKDISQMFDGDCRIYEYKE